MGNLFLWEGDGERFVLLRVLSFYFMLFYFVLFYAILFHATLFFCFVCFFSWNTGCLVYIESRGGLLRKITADVLDGYTADVLDGVTFFIAWESAGPCRTGVL